MIYNDSHLEKHCSLNTEVQSDSIVSIFWYLYVFNISNISISSIDFFYQEVIFFTLSLSVKHKKCCPHFDYCSISHPYVAF